MDIHDKGDALQGLDRTRRFSVHPNATHTRFTAFYRGPADSGAIVGTAHYQLVYPGGRTAPCGGGSTALVVHATPQTIIDKPALDVGDYRLRLWAQPLPTYDMVIEVQY